MTDNDYIFIPFCGDEMISDTLLVAPGDAFRWLVMPCKGIRPGDSIRLVNGDGVETVVGGLRKCRSEFYTDLILAVGNVPDSYKQFALEVAGRSITTTFYPDPAGYVDRLAYAQAIARHLANQPFIAVDVYRSGFVIYLRIYDGQRIRLAGQSVTVGLGKVVTPNSNVPVLRVTKSTPVSYAASWPYKVTVGASIEAGNIYRLDAVSYTAQDGDTISQVRAGLGLSLDESTPISRSTATYPTATAEPDTGRFANANTPTLNLQYNGVVSGNDTYLVIVGGDIQEGNVYQIQVTGSADRIAVATSTSTVSSLTTALVSGGILSVTAGITPNYLTDPGYQVATNTNTPSLNLTALTPLPARTLDRWAGYVSSDIVGGNRYELSIGGVAVSYVAQTGDTAGDVAQALGRQGGSFVIEVPTATAVFARTFRGNAYHAPEYVAPVTLTQSDRPVGGPWVAELTIPADTSGTFKLVCGSVYSSVRFRVGNTAIVAIDTSVVRWSASQAEDNLICQLRLPIYLSVDRMQQTESTYPDLSGLTTRNRATSRKSSVLTTMSQSAQFHRAMWAMLKSDTITLDGTDWQQQGDYSITDGTPPQYRGQGRCTLLATRQVETRPFWAAVTTSTSANYAVISSLDCVTALSLQVKGYSFEGQLRAGLQFPAGEYQLRVAAGADALTLRIEGPTGEVTQYVLWPQTTNRLRNIRFEPGPHRISIKPVGPALIGADEVAGFGDPETSLTATAETVNVPDFSPDFNNDYY